VVCRRWSDDGVLMSWYATPSDREAAAVRALGEYWARMQEENRVRGEVEAERLRVMWEGIEVGAVELTEEATVRRGGLRMLRADGSVVLEVVELLEIEGDVARVRTTGGRGGYEVIERLSRGDIEGMQELNLEVEEQVVEHPAARYWSIE
jgi:hypothetical protein